MANAAFDTEQVFGGEAQSLRPGRSWVEAMKRGFLCRCPNCGQGKLFRAYLKTVDNCSVCGEDISHHRADDLPAYLVVVIVGHVVVAGFMATELLTNWSSWQHIALWVPVTIILSIALLQPVKGAVVGIQWANYMHGFGGTEDQPESHWELEQDRPN